MGSISGLAYWISLSTLPFYKMQVIKKLILFAKIIYYSKVIEGDYTFNGF